MALEYDDALNAYWGMTGKERNAIDRSELTGKELSALTLVDEALTNHDTTLMKFITERTIGRATAKREALEKDYDGMAEKLKLFLRGEYEQFIEKMEESDGGLE